jgi:hypothetical protein
MRVMPDIPSIEPSTIVAGDTVKWTRSLADYSAAAGWVLKYRLINAAGKIDITASASGADHLVDEAAATTDAWTAGTYTWQAYVEKAAERYTVGRGTLVIEPDLPAEAAGYETRTTAKQILDELESAYLDYSSNGQGTVQRYTIGGREMWFRAATDFIKQIEYWRSQVVSQQALESVANGLGNPRRLYARFGRA